jgi:uncharacterized YigZ family protein
MHDAWRPTFAARMNHYFTIEKEAVAEYKDRGSKFLAYAFPIEATDAFKARLKALKEEHPKAAHHCFAYRLGMDKNNYRASDDGEPSGTAGKPILGQIDSKELTNLVVVVVRYFGGTLLGVPGLIQAYRTSASLVLQLTPIIQNPVLIQYELLFDYTLVNEVMMNIKRFQCPVLVNEMQLFCRMVIGVQQESEAACVQKFNDLHGVEVKKIKA